MDPMVRALQARFGLTESQAVYALSNDANVPLLHRRAAATLIQTVATTPSKSDAPRFKDLARSFAWDHKTRVGQPQPVCFASQQNQLILFPNVYSLPDMALQQILGETDVRHVAATGTTLVGARYNWGFIIWRWNGTQWQYHPQFGFTNHAAILPSSIHFSPNGIHLCWTDEIQASTVITKPGEWFGTIPLLTMSNARCAQFLSDTIMVFLTSMQDILKMMDLNTQVICPTWTGVRDVAALGDGQRVAATTMDGKLVCGAPQEPPQCQRTVQATGLIASPTYVAARVDHQVHVWEPNHLTLVRVLDMMYVSALCFHPQGHWLATSRHPNNNYAHSTHVDVWPEYTM